MSDNKCPECLAELPVPQGVMQGEIITCPDCGESWEVKSTSPWLITRAESQGEDWGE